MSKWRFSLHRARDDTSSQIFQKFRNRFQQTRSQL